MNTRIINTIAGTLGLSGWGTIVIDLATDVDLPGWARVVALTLALGLAVWQALPDVNPKDGTPDIANGFWRWLEKKLPWRRSPMLLLAALSAWMALPTVGCGVRGSVTEEPFAAIDSPVASGEADGSFRVEDGEFTGDGQLRLEAAATGYVWLVRLRASLYAAVSPLGILAGTELLVTVAKLAETGGRLECAAAWADLAHPVCRWCVLWEGGDAVCGDLGSPTPPPAKPPEPEPPPEPVS